MSYGYIPPAWRMLLAVLCWNVMVLIWLSPVWLPIWYYLHTGREGMSWLMVVFGLVPCVSQSVVFACMMDQADAPWPLFPSERMPEKQVKALPEPKHSDWR